MNARSERPPWEDEHGRVPLARLFGMAFSTLIEDLHARLAKSGFDDARPAFGFVLLKARHQSVTAKEIAEQNGTSKQAATKLLALMESCGYLRRAPNNVDGRERPFELTPRGRKLLTRVEAIYRELEAEWARVIGNAGVESVRSEVTRALRARHGGNLPPVR
ncbi:MAG TPA: MarR family transcriptional regulator, partial [Polyangiaceae bacterium]